MSFKLLGIPAEIASDQRFVIVGSEAEAVIAAKLLPKQTVLWPSIDNAVDFLPIETWGTLRGHDILLWPANTYGCKQGFEVLAKSVNLITDRLRMLYVNGEDPEGFSAVHMADWTGPQLAAWAKGRARAWAKPEPATDPMLDIRESEPQYAQEPPPAEYERPEDDGWGAPLDLWTETPVLPMNVACLPSPLHDFVLEQSELIGTDPTVIGMACLITCASMIDDRYRVQPKEHDTSWTEPARLWTAIVGEPSAKKSPGMISALRPLRKIDARMAEHHQSNMEEYDEAMNEYAKTTKKDRGALPKKPPCPRTIVSNTTVEALSEILKDNAQGVLCVYDELSGWFGSMDIYSKGGGGKDRAMWLEAYNGGPQRIDRIQRGQLYIPNWSACILGGIQPDAFRTVASRMDNDGLLQRFMIVLAGQAPPDNDRVPDMRVINDYADLVQDLRERLPSGDEPVVYKLSPEAQTVRRTFMTTIEGVQRGDLPKGMAGYIGKWSGLFARLLCAYHLIENIGAHRKPPPLIEAETAMRVCELMETVLYQHAYQFYSEQLGRSDVWVHVRWIAGHLLAKGVEKIATRDLIQAYKEMRNMDDRQKAAIFNALVDYQWIRPDESARVNAGTRAATRWVVNPVIATTFSPRREVERRERAERLNVLKMRTSE